MDRDPYRSEYTAGLSEAEFTFMIPKSILFFDTETTGVDVRKDRVVELAWLLCSPDGKTILEETRLIKPEGFVIPEEAAKIHGITTQIADEEGEDFIEVIKKFLPAFHSADLIVGHNVLYDIEIIKSECSRFNVDSSILNVKPRFCTMNQLTAFCKIPRLNGGTGYKFPSLSEAYEILTGSHLIACHDALVDTEACKAIFFSAIEKRVIRFNEEHPMFLAEVVR